MSKIFKNFLESLGYDINKPSGKSCLGLNIFDFILLLVYLVFIFSALWIYGIHTLSYIATIILSFRALVEFGICQKKAKTQGSAIAIVYTISFVIYIFLILVLALFYFFANDILIKVLASLYYLTFAFFETTNILARCFEAEPHLYK